MSSFSLDYLTLSSDRGSQFASKVFNRIFEAIGVKHKMSTAFHPQTDRQTECYNQELEAYVRIYCTYKPDEWSNKLSLVQFAHNSRTHEALQKSPFELIYGTKPIALPEASEKTNSPVANDCISQLYKSHKEALAAHELAHWNNVKEAEAECIWPKGHNGQLTGRVQGMCMQWPEWLGAVRKQTGRSGHTKWDWMRGGGAITEYPHTCGILYILQHTRQPLGTYESGTQLCATAGWLGTLWSATIQHVRTVWSVLEHQRNIAGSSWHPSQPSWNWWVTPHKDEGKNHASL